MVEEQGVTARPDGPGSREPSPTVSALTGFDPSRIAEGSFVSLADRGYWAADYGRLAKSGRLGVVERLFTPAGGNRLVARVVFPQRGRAKERVEYFDPKDLIASGMQLREDGLPAEAEGLQPGPNGTPPPIQGADNGQ